MGMFTAHMPFIYKEMQIWSEILPDMQPVIILNLIDSLQRRQTPHR